jgi:hypothetical protein
MMKKSILIIALMCVQLFCGMSMVDAQETYKVGDFYCDDDKMGVVFWVDESGQCGKIVSLAESPRLEWAKRRDCMTNFSAYDRTNGIYNLMRISIQGSWMERFPAFGWCEELGDVWYLPAVDELKLLLSKEVVEAVNDTLSELYQLGGVPINVGYDEDGAVRWYWSSTEPTEPKHGDPCFAYAVLCSGGEEFQLDKEQYRCYVRAIAKFGNEAKRGEMTLVPLQ